MAFLSDKDLSKIESDLKDKIQSGLLDNFKNRSGRLIIEVDSVSIEYSVDENKSDRDNIIISPIHAHARVWVDNGDNNSKGNDQIALRINSVKFQYNDNTKSFEIEDNNQIVLIDMS